MSPALPQAWEPPQPDHSTGPPCRALGWAWGSLAWERGAPPGPHQPACTGFVAWPGTPSMPLSAFPVSVATLFQPDCSLQTLAQAHSLPLQCITSPSLWKETPRGPLWPWPLLPLFPSPAKCQPSCLWIYSQHSSDSATRPFPGLCLSPSQMSNGTLPAPLALFFLFFFDFSSLTRNEPWALAVRVQVHHWPLEVPL